MDSLDRIYEIKFGNTDSLTSLGWGSLNSQQIRFKILLEIIGFLDSDSVLDVGCGHGDISVLIKNYTGIDLREHAISVASSKYKNRKFIKCSIDDIHDKYDWVFASGIFCFNDDNWHTNTNKTLSKMFDICTKGVSVNFLSNLSTGNKDVDMKYTDIQDIIFAIGNITNKFTIRHDYLQNDICVYLYK